MSDFAPAIAAVLRHEGGYVDDPADHGGETNYGISQFIIRHESLTAADLGLPSLEHGALKALTPERAAAIYRAVFWDRYGYGRIRDQRCASKVFDTAVNMGPAWAARLAQMSCTPSSPLEVDGVIGPATVRAINETEPQVFLAAFSARQAQRYAHIIDADATQEAFRSNWMRRAAWLGD